MRILVVSDLYPPNVIGGFEIACKRVVDGLRSFGHEVHVLTTQGLNIHEDKYLNAGLDLKFFFDHEPTRPDLVRNMLFEAKVSVLHNTYTVINAIETIDPDVVYLWNLLGVGGLAILDAVTQCNRPTLMHLMDCVPVYLAAGLPTSIREIFNSADLAVFHKVDYISMSSALLREIKSEIGLDIASTATIIPGWVDAKPNILPRSYNVDGHTRFVTAGSVKDHKGIGLIVEAAAKLKDLGYLEFDVDIVGEGDIAEFSEFAEQLGVGSIVNFVGWKSQEDLFNSYVNYDSFLFPTWPREPFGFAPLEAAFYGCVPIVTSTCGVSERLVDEIHCIKISRTVDDLSRAMAGVIDQRYDLPGIARNNAALLTTSLSFAECIGSINRKLSSIASTGERSIINYQRLRRQIKLKHEIATECLDNWQ